MAVLRYSHYTTGDNPEQRIALYGVDAVTGEHLHTLTVNFDDLDVNPGHVWIKNWSENAGVLDALVKARIGTKTGRTCRAGHVWAHELKLSAAVYKDALRVTRAEVRMAKALAQEGAEAEKVH